jgi:hypothetical protein
MRSLKGRQWGDAPGSRLMPSPGLWQVDLEPGERLVTPTDGRGLVDIPATINLVKRVAPRNYAWAPNLSVHHFYWPGADYEEMGETARAFRELPIHKGLVLREWENLLHTITAPSPMPDEDVMAYRVEAWRVAHDLFESVSQAVAWEKRTRRRDALIRRHPEILPPEFNGEDKIGREVLGDILDKHFQGVDQHLERAAQIPPEHRLFDHEAGYEQLATQLGQLVVPSSVLLIRSIAA